ncbi:hypothetical protein TBC1_111222 [Lentimicrobium saccharophilum]|uniref:OmpA-like domain-containing protein n=1 Tax=Lentimicrobium saccharophilum TaxID=1678841 RepID=A0A0S7C268_9BACT|nr:DUF748 domain-containing protein [Lentimicrobium saccharophilum]GAP43080.1 hypothetical protein TBC1_111222 [Lentimicrobium saccharophilum]
MKRFTKLIALLLGIVAGIVILLAVFISPVAEYLIEKNSREWTGRKIEMDRLVINLLNGKVGIKLLKVYETDDRGLFVAAGKIRINTALLSFLTGRNIVEDVLIENAIIQVLQNGESFNFDDLILRFAAGDTVEEPADGAPVAFEVRNIEIRNNTLNYKGASPLVNISIENLNITCPVISSADPRISISATCAFNQGGDLTADLFFNQETSVYNLKAGITDFSLTHLYPYMKDYLLVESLEGLVSADLRLDGNAGNPADIAASGDFVLREFSVADTTGEVIASVGKLLIDADSINSAGNVYHFGVINIDRPYVKFAVYDDGINFDRMLIAAEEVDSVNTGTVPVEDYANLFRMIADYVQFYTSQYKVSNYKAGKVLITNGRVVYTDYTLEDKFQYELDSLFISSENLNSSSERINVVMKSKLNQTGIFSGNLSINPDGYSEMEMNYSIKGIRLSDINPYSVYYVATPFIDGDLTFENEIYIRDHKLKSENRLFIERVVAGKRVQNNTAMNIPVRLAISVLRDLKGNIRLSIPVEGDLDDPDYRWGKALLQVLKNLAIKAAVAPYRLVADMFGGSEDDYREMKMEFLQQQPDQDNLVTLGRIAEVILNKPELSVHFTPGNSREAEIEFLATYMAKQKFLGLGFSDSLSPEDDLRIRQISNRDPGFTAWLGEQSGVSAALASVQEKSVQLSGRAHLETRISAIEEERTRNVKNYLISKGISADRIKMSGPSAANTGNFGQTPSFAISFAVSDEEIESESSTKQIN